MKIYQVQGEKTNRLCSVILRPAVDLVRDAMIGRRDESALQCHSERERRISHAGHRDSSLTLRMTSWRFAFLPTFLWLLNKKVWAN